MSYGLNPYDYAPPRASTHDADWYRDDALASGEDDYPLDWAGDDANDDFATTDLRSDR